MNMHGDYIMILSDLLGRYIKRGGAPDRLQSWLATSATGIYIYIYIYINSLWFPKTNSGTKPENAKSQSKTHHIG